MAIECLRNTIVTTNKDVRVLHLALPQLQEERCDTEIDASAAPIVLERDGRTSPIGGLCNRVMG